MVTTTDRSQIADRHMAPLVVAGVLGGLLHAVKGLVLVVGGPDLSLVPAMILLFGFGLVALHRRVSGNRAVGLARTGSALAWGVVAFGVLSVGCWFLDWQPEDPSDPAVADVAYGGGTLMILIGLLLLGVVWARDTSIPRPWRLVPLVVGVVWFPLEALTAVTPDGWGLLLAGVAWILAAVSPAFSFDR